MPTEGWDRIDPEATTPHALATAYLDVLGERDDGVGDATREAIQEGRPEAIDLDGVAAILAAGLERRDATAVEYELLDRLLIGMTNAVLDVDTLADEIELSRSPKELQQRIEGREPMTLEEFAHIRHAIARRSP